MQYGENPCIRRLLLGLLMIGLLWGAAPVMEAAPVTVKVCGEGSNDAAAREDARRKAVDRVLLQMQVEEQERGQILARFSEFAAMPTVTARKKQSGRIYLMSNVQVDADAIQNLLARAGAQAQEKQEDLSACFLVRIRGNADSAQVMQGLRRVQEIMGHTFQDRGFATDVSDQLVRELGNSAGDYAGFRQQMLQKVQRDYPEITVAVIGEIVLKPVHQDASGCTRSADIRVSAIDVLHQRVIADYEEAYQVRRLTGEEANLMALEKAAMNAAETLAGKSLQYYRQ